MKVAFGAAMLAAVAASSQVFNFMDTLNNSTTTAEGVSRLDIDSSSRFFVDQDDRQVLLHGVNVVYKVDPYIPSTGDWDTEDSLDDHDIELLKQWGFNFVRLGVMWEAVEREEGVYDEEYLNKVETMINKLGDAGIYTLVDAHQDVFSRQICGEGVPTFYAEKAIGKHPVCFNNLLDPILSPLLSHFGLCTDINDMGYSYDEDGLPTIPDCQSRDFYTYYMTKESMEAFHSLLVTNAHGVQDAFVNFWDRVTERFAGNNYVVGYDPLNEPFPGNPTRDLTLTWPGKFDREYLQPLYSKIYTNAKKHDATKHLWFEPVPFPDEMGVLGGYVFHTGFTEPPGAEMGSAYHALNDHTYCCQMSSSECLTGEPKIEDYDQCLSFHQKRLYTREEDAQNLGVPFIITEFGACLTEGPCTQEINQVAQVADEILAGWAYWQYKTYEDLTTSASTGAEGFWNKDGSLQDYKVKALGRPYLQYTQGRLTSMKYDDELNTFHAEFTLGSNLSTGSSVAFLSQEYYYPAGIDATITVDGVAVAPESVNLTYQDGYLSFAFDQSFTAGAKVVLDVQETA